MNKYILLILVFSVEIICKTPAFMQDSKWASETLKSLSLREKIGQLFIVAAASNLNQPTESLATAVQKCPYNKNPDYLKKIIEQYNVGGIIFLFKSDPKSQILLKEELQAKAKIPLLIAQDLEWGLSQGLDNHPSKVVRYPHNMTLGAIQDEKLTYDLGYEVGKQCAAIGVHMNFAPVIDINNNPANPVIHDRSFGDDKERVARLGTLFMLGLQHAGIITCAKHFPGHGDTNIDSHFDLPVIKHDKNRLESIEMFPFKRIIAEGVDAVMNAHLAIPAFAATSNKPASLSYSMVTQELQKNLGFEGLVVSDGLGMGALTKHYKPGEIELHAFLAGNDILLCPLDVPLATDFIEQAIKSGQINEEELDRRVLKILKAKAWAFEQQSKYNISDVYEYLVRPEAVDLQEKLYNSAITVAKNNLSPIMIKNSYIIQIGMLPDNAFLKTLNAHSECSPQVNVSKNEEKIIAAIYSPDLPDYELEDSLKKSKNKDQVIIVMAEVNKFAIKNYGIADNAVKLINNLKAKNKKVIVIIFGTPYSIKFFSNADTIIIAYEKFVPAQKAAANFLLGKINAIGKLPVNLNL